MICTKNMLLREYSQYDREIEPDESAREVKRNGKPLKNEEMRLFSEQNVGS